MDTQDSSEWLGRYRDWEQKQADYASAQKTLDDAVTLYMEAKGPPPNRGQLRDVEALRNRMLEARKAVNAFISGHAVELARKRNLPRHE